MSELSKSLGTMEFDGLIADIKCPYSQIAQLFGF